jgi:hypothetical protein
LKTIRIASGRGRFRYAVIPETLVECRTMLIEAVDKKHDDSGGDAYRNSVAGRVAYGIMAFGLLGDEVVIPNPTLALNHLLQKICGRK